MKIINNVLKIITEKMSQTKKVKSTEDLKLEEVTSLADKMQALVDDSIKFKDLNGEHPTTIIGDKDNDYLMWNSGHVHDPTATTMVNKEQPPTNTDLGYTSYDQIRNTYDRQMKYYNPFEKTNIAKIDPVPVEDSPVNLDLLKNKQREEQVKYEYPLMPGKHKPAPRKSKDAKGYFDDAINEYLKKGVSITPDGVRVNTGSVGTWVERNDVFDNQPYNDVDNKKNSYDNIPEDLLHDLNVMFSNNSVSLSIPDSIAEISKELNVLREILVDNVKHTKTSDEVVSSLFDLLISLKKTIDGN
jgi:hypothetical protein